MRPSRRRGEGITEYIIIVSMIMVCAVVGLLKAGSGAIERLANAKALCADCPDMPLSEADLDELERLREKKRELEAQVPPGALSEAEKKALDDRERRSGNTTEDDPSNPRPAPQPSPLDRFMNSLFGPNWRNDSFLASFAFIFGWFGLWA
jgi:hypothetical protein